MRLLCVLILCMAAFSTTLGPAYAETRVALVIGNSAYKNAPLLTNPRNDAEDVAASLKRNGFDTIVGFDLDKSGMDEIEIRFARAARTADVAMFYFSGHAVQFGGILEGDAVANQPARMLPVHWRLEPPSCDARQHEIWQGG
jgi:hypothetical protein